MKIDKLETIRNAALVIKIASEGDITLLEYSHIAEDILKSVYKDKPKLKVL